MNEKLTKRKADFVRYLDEELAGKPLKWWQQKVNDYIPTRDMGSGKNSYPHDPEETMIRYDFKRALFSSALFFILGFMILVSSNDVEKTGSFWIMNCFLALVIIYQVVHTVRSKRYPLIFNKDGFRIGKMPGPVPWKYLTASYIRKNNSGEDPRYYLLIYYFDEAKDEFEETEYNIDGLDMQKEDIAALIEYWKTVPGNNTVMV